ncbi:MAG: MerR family transcriptional regulator [Cyanothece sp. SIO2G6]|nr:MerR family transcriptional regulator [Cyanothece sp. SIO2G6]
MSILEPISQSKPLWSLDELVQVANDVLPQFLPEEKAHTRVREAVSPRLIRHYTSQGMLDEPLKEGREARYVYRHLLQVLLVRRLLTEGYGASVIDSLARSKPNQELEALLQGGVQLTVTPANPALAFLQDIQQRQSGTKRSSPRRSLSPQPMPLPSPAPSASSLGEPTQWQRLEVLPGLEIHVRSDFVLPTTSQEQHSLQQRILQLLRSLSRPKRRSKS